MSNFFKIFESKELKARKERCWQKIKEKTKNTLILNKNKRYEFNGYELHCGDVVEISIDGVNWVKTRIEYSDRYYAVANPDLSLRGLYCRFISD